MKTYKQFISEVKQSVKKAADAIAPHLDSLVIPNLVPLPKFVKEENTPTNPELWSRAKSLAKKKFKVYPSAYANGWAAKWYKSKGGGWKSTGK
jgi:hypothetical protein